MSLPLLICSIATPCVILIFQWHFVSIGTDLAVTLECKGIVHLQRSHPDNENCEDFYISISDLLSIKQK